MPTMTGYVFDDQIDITSECIWNIDNIYLLNCSYPLEWDTNKKNITIADS